MSMSTGDTDPFFEIMSGQEFDIPDSRVLERAMHEPFIAKTLEDAVCFNELLAQGGNGDVLSALQFANELDQRVISAMGIPAKVTGVSRVLPLSLGVDNSNGYLFRSSDHEANYIYQLPLVFCGFIVELSEEDGPQIRVQAYSIEGDGSNPDDMVYYSISPEGVVLDLGATMSKERAAAWLEVFVPDVKEEIDARILNSSDRDLI